MSREKLSNNNFYYNIFSMTANLPYSPPMNTDNDYHQTFFADFFVSDTIKN